jgi:hypothetical protein
MDKAASEIAGALEERLRELNREIDECTRRAAAATDEKEQQREWDRAADLQREARSVRRQIVRK